VQDYRNIYLISYNKDVYVDGCITVDESIFPFMPFIANYFAAYQGKSNRNGWYFQQLLKLYAGQYIPDLLENYLVIDADVFFLKDIHFFTEDGKPYFACGDENHTPYFDHMRRLHPSLRKQRKESGICHHMMMNQGYLRALFEKIETYHHSKDNDKPFWQLFIEQVQEHRNHSIDQAESGASEYELYFHFMLAEHPHEIEVRPLRWSNVTHQNFQAHQYSQQSYYDYVSVCAWLGW
jgi:hypothetical protein